MTAYSSTVTNNISSAGPTPATLFDATTSQWDVANWDDKTLDLVTDVNKLIAESQGSTSAKVLTPSKLISESEATTSTIINSPFKTLSESQATSVSISDEEKFDGTLRWNYDFAPLTPNFESAATATFSSPTNNSISWSTVVTNVVGWS